MEAAVVTPTTYRHLSSTSIYSGQMKGNNPVEGINFVDGANPENFDEVEGAEMLKEFS